LRSTRSPQGTRRGPRVDVRISNINRVLEGYVLAYDNYIKTSGFSPIVIDLYLLNSKNLASATPEVWHQFELNSQR